LWISVLSLVAIREEPLHDERRIEPDGARHIVARVEDRLVLRVEIHREVVAEPAAPDDPPDSGRPPWFKSVFTIADPSHSSGDPTPGSDTTLLEMS